MKIPLSWLSEYIDIALPTAQISKILTSLGLEVDAVEAIVPSFSKVVVGKVTGIAKHPNAEKLCVATVTDGIEFYQVVCGAPNCRMGLKTAFAMVGAALKDEQGKIFKIKPVKLRGVESFGMLCSGKELGLSQDTDGIMEFSDQMKEGRDVADLYAETVFDISLTPNLGHCMHILGIARELSAATHLPVKYPSIHLRESNEKPLSDFLSVSVENKIKCPRYACRLVRNVKIGPSPDWLKKKLESCGIRAINNVVDVTNYVLMEMGQPLHAFDYDRLEGHSIVVKCPKDEETFITLDGKERVITSEDLLICDNKKAIAIAGIMGGGNSEVSTETRNILIESAYFQPSSIRRTSKRLGLQTDASKRFERGIDPNGILKALDRAAMLMQEICGGEIVAGAIDIQDKPFLEKIISCRLSRLNGLLGTKLGVTEVEYIFTRLGFQARFEGNDIFYVKIPTYRGDLHEEIDLIEEVARIHGYDNIPRIAPRYQGSLQPHAPIFLFERKVRSRLLAEGLQDFLTCDLIGPSLMNMVKDNMMPLKSMVEVLNPTSIEQSLLRTSLLPGLLQVVKYNADHECESISGFEIGRIHFKEENQYKEQPMAAIILTGKKDPYHYDPKPREVDFFDLKGILENLFSELKIENIHFTQNDLKLFHPGRQSSIYVNAVEIGAMGEIHPAIQRRLDVAKPILYAEINLQELFNLQKRDQKMKDLPIYPSSERDWTITLDENIPIEKVQRSLSLISSSILEKVYLLDLFRSERIGQGKKNATFHFVYRDKEKTVETEVVDKEHEKIINEALKLLQNGQ